MADTVDREEFEQAMKELGLSKVCVDCGEKECYPHGYGDEKKFEWRSEGDSE